MAKVAIILAAGSGKRIGLSCPKGLITVAGQTLIERSIESLLKSGIEQIYIGVGYEAEQYQFLARKYSQVFTILNPLYEKYGSFSTFHKVLKVTDVTEPVLLLDSDIIYGETCIDEIQTTEDSLLVSAVTGSGDEVYVHLGYQWDGVQLIKEIRKDLPSDLESIGICHLSRSSVKAFKESEYDSPLYQKREYDPLLADNLDLTIVKTESPWREIDNMTMYNDAQKIFDINGSPLTSEELNLKSKWKKLKSKSGTHSPSIGSIEEMIGREVIDLCFLSNPYATKLFQNKISKLNAKELRKIIEYYPSQNAVIAEKISTRIKVPAKNIFVGNGAIEPIQVIVQSVRSIGLIIPTFSSYYEYITPDTKVHYYNLRKNQSEDDGLAKHVPLAKSQYRLDPIKYVDFLNENQVELGVIINPNNPDGSYVDFEDLIYIIEHANCKIVVDESFVHFCAKKYQTAESIFENYSNLYIVKSLSKDFGVSGLRCGYAIMSEKEVSSLLSNGYLWNVNGFAEYFYNLFSQDEFYKQYEKARLRYMDETREFFDQVKAINGLIAHDSAANFILIDPQMRSDDFSIKLLNKGILVRDCSDKIGLDGNYVRISSKDKETNAYVIQSIREIYE